MEFNFVNGTIGTKKEFNETVVAALGTIYSDGYSVSVRKVSKNNDIFCDGLTIVKNGINISPTIYLESFYDEYKKGRSLGSIVKHISNLYECNKHGAQFDIKEVENFEIARNKICIKLVNAEKNKEILANTPHLKYLDLAVIFYIQLGMKDDEIMSTTVKDWMLDKWEITEKELFYIAYENTRKMNEYKIENIFKRIFHLMDEEMREMVESMDGNIIPMYVASNKKMINGASILLYNDIMGKFADKFNDDFYIIPSSIHECIFIPAKYVDYPEEIKIMVMSVNPTLNPEEVLSENVYIYKRALRNIEIC